MTIASLGTWEKIKEKSFKVFGAWIELYLNNENS